MLNLDHVKKYFARIAIGLVIGASFSIVNAQSSTATAKGTAPAQVLVNQTTQIPTTELAVVRAQLEDNRKFQDQLLATVYWSLGTLATVAVLLTGFGWFANTKMYERDKAALERDLRGQLFEEIRASKQALETDTAIKFKEQDNYISEKVDKDVELATKTISKDIEELEKKLASRISNSAANLARLTNDIHHLNLKNALLMREEWKKKNVTRNMLQETVNALVLTNTLGDKYEQGDVLDFLREDMDAVIKAKNNPIDNYLIAQLIKALDSVEGDHAHSAAVLKGKIATLSSV